MTIYRCRKCRHFLFSDDCVILDHGQKDVICSASSNTTVWFLSCDSEKTPEWINEALSSGCWSKGKLYCPKCQGRIGSFDFISRNRCPCGQFTLPPLHILSCRVDKMTAKLQQQGIVNQYQRRPADLEGATCSARDQSGNTDDNPNMGVNDVITEVVPPGTTNNTSYQSSSNATGHPKDSEQKKRRIRKRRILMHGISSNEEKNATFGNPYEILLQERDDDSRKESQLQEDIKKLSREIPTVAIVPEEYCCSVCLDIYCYPTKCQPCNHTFCDPCLRRLALTKPRLTPCPLCRVTITSCTPDTELGEQLTKVYPEEYKERTHKERKACSDKFYQLPKCTYPSLHRPRLAHLSGFSRGQVVLMAILLTACFCFSPMKSLVYSMFNLLFYFLDNLIYFFDSAATVMAVHDILQLF